MFVVFLLNEALADSSRPEPYYYYQQTKEYRDSIVKKANNGDIEAIYKVGYNYYYGENSFKKDYALAYEYLLIGARRNHGKSAYVLGLFYQNNKIDRVSHYNAAICFTHAASLKNWDGIVNLALKFWNGEGVVQDYIVAYALYQVAAPLDNSRAYYTSIQRTKLEKVLSPDDVAKAKKLGKELTKSSNFFTVIDAYLQQDGRSLLEDPLLGFDSIRELGR